MNSTELFEWSYFFDRETPRPPYCNWKIDKEREILRKQIEALKLKDGMLTNKTHIS